MSFNINFWVRFVTLSSLIAVSSAALADASSLTRPQPIDERIARIRGELSNKRHSPAQDLFQSSDQSTQLNSSLVACWDNTNWSNKSWNNTNWSNTNWDNAWDNPNRWLNSWANSST